MTIQNIVPALKTRHSNTIEYKVTSTLKENKSPAVLLLAHMYTAGRPKHH